MAKWPKIDVGVCQSLIFSVTDLEHTNSAKSASH